MHILMTGGNGFVAREIIIALTEAGHTMIVCVRQLSTVLQKNKDIHYIETDFARDVDQTLWMQRLHNIDVVINCVGVFHTTCEKEMWNIHFHTPRALFDAAVVVGVKKIIHLSALGIDQTTVVYAASKLMAEQYLQNLSIDSVIIRPSFIYAHSSYGGSSLFRGLAGLPFFTFLPGGGKKLLQPIHLHDLVTIVKKSLYLQGKKLLCAVGSEKISFKMMITHLRVWLGFKNQLMYRFHFFLFEWLQNVEIFFATHRSVPQLFN